MLEDIDDISDDESFMRSCTFQDIRNAPILSITELTRCIRGVIEAEDLFADVWVRGEVSNYVNHTSGHRYFYLKDDAALIRCVIWSSAARSLKFDLKDGMNVLARGRVSVYEKQGQYQLSVSQIMPDGAGALFLAYEQLKRVLSDEGLFDEDRKKPIPSFPQNIAVITSPTAAALQDMISIARRRMPSVNLLIIPTLMQGAGSRSSVVQSLKTADEIREIDVIILGRGGGAIEDLWTFNSESVVRTIASCRTPVVSAIGHETDFTLSDFAADLRAPTPSAAIELVLPERSELTARITALNDALCYNLKELLASKRSALDTMTGTIILRHPEKLIQDRWQSLDLLQSRLERSFLEAISSKEFKLGKLYASLESLSPIGVLARGYTITRKAKDGTVVRSISQAESGEILETLISDGILITEVIGKKEGCE